ncbi:MAG: DUF4421 family protein [Bacteroidetes bacterium]|nr:DUF4421 family protein [Bacteroidota bacterium]
MTLKSVALIFLVLVSSVGLGQNKELDALSRANYVERFTNYFFVWPVLKQRNTSFYIQSADGSQRLTFKPNVSFHAGAGFYIFGVGAQIVLALPTTRSSDQLYGHSDAFDLQANILGKNWGLDFFTQNYIGYYSEDKNKPLSVSAIHPQRKDVVTWNNGVNGIYFFNKRKYSMRSTYNYYERQLRSAGSFLLSANANTFSLRGDSAIYSSSFDNAFGTGANFQRLDYSTFSAAPGYAHTFVIRKIYFIGGAFAYGPAINWVHYNLGNNPWKEDWQLNTFADLRISAGYNSERFFAGVTYSHQTRNIKYAGVLFSSSNDAIKFAVGYRFKEVGILKRRAYDIFKPKTS